MAAVCDKSLLEKKNHLPKTLGIVSERGLRLPFSPEEADALRRGVVSHPPLLASDGKPWYQWSAILNDPELRPYFHASRTSVNLKVRVC